LSRIWLAGGDTSDQDIWECYYDIYSSVRNIDFWNNLPLNSVSFMDWVNIMFCGKRPSTNPLARSLILRTLYLSKDLLIF
jgi:hypothetical protein